MDAPSPRVLARHTAAALLALGAIAAPLSAQTDPAPAAEVTERAPLLREGSALIDAVGMVMPSRQTGAWDFIVSSPEVDGPPHVLTLLPCGFVSELEQVLAATEGQKRVVEMTGAVYEFGGENYLLLSIPARVRDPERMETPPPAPMPTAEEDSSTTGNGDDGADDTESIIAELERNLGPVARRTPGGNEPAVVRRKIVSEGTKVVRRRGQVRRTVQGGYIFTFDADATGLADPPMTLLPCRLLERIDRHLRRQPQQQSAILITGHVYAYDGQNFLLPTVFQVPRERTVLTPTID